MSKGPIPENEVERLLDLGSLDLDYTELEDDFKDIVALASKISGMDVSLINLIDPYTQWTIARKGLDIESMGRDESVCQYTIMGNGSFEVADLTADDRFSQRSYVTGPPNLKTYFGIPLTTRNGVNIGALCVLDSKPKEISSERKEMMEILASEVVNKLRAYHELAVLRDEFSGAEKKQKQIAQDVRDPLAGIIGISEILMEQQCEPKKETLEYISLINESSKLILGITDDVLVENPEEIAPDESFTLSMLKEKLEKLYRPIADAKNIRLNMISESFKNGFPIPKSSVLQIAGTLISSGINLLESADILEIHFDINIQPDMNSLNITVRSSRPTFMTTSADLHEKVLRLTSQLVSKINGTLSLSGDGENLLYELKLPFPA